MRFCGNARGIFFIKCLSFAARGVTIYEISGEKMEYVFSDRMKNMGGNAIREIFKLLSRPDMISFAGGFPTASLLPCGEVGEIASDLMNSDRAKEILQYGATEGYAPLRRRIAAFVSRYGIEGAGEENVRIVSGGQQTIDLMCKCFVNDGDVVLVEDPTYLASLHILRTYRGKAVGVRSGDEGLDLHDLEQKIKAFKPKMLYCVPTFSNPTGRTYSLAVRKAIAELTAKYGVMVLEDDPYSEIRFCGERVPSIKSFDKCGNVVFTASFSKTISPGLRVGYCVGDPAVMAKLTIGKQAVDVHTSMLSQAIVEEYFARGLFDKVLSRSIPVYKEKKDAMHAAIERYMPEEFSSTDPFGGLFIWGGFAEKSGVDTACAFAGACERGVAYVSGETFFADGKDRRHLRLNYSAASPEQIERGIKILADYFKELIK